MLIYFTRTILHDGKVIPKGTVLDCSEEEADFFISEKKVAEKAPEIEKKDFLKIKEMIESNILAEIRNSSDDHQIETDTPKKKRKKVAIL